MLHFLERAERKQNRKREKKIRNSKLRSQRGAQIDPKQIQIGAILGTFGVSNRVNIWNEKWTPKNVRATRGDTPVRGYGGATPPISTLIGASGSPLSLS